MANTVKTTKKALAQMKAAQKVAAKAVREVNAAIAALEDGTLAQGVVAVKNGIEYIRDRKGRIVRQPSKDKPVTREEVLYMLRGVRVVDEDEALELVGPNVLSFMLEKGSLVRDAKMRSFLWVTKHAQEVYGLSKPVVQGVVCEFHPAPKAKAGA